MLVAIACQATRTGYRLRCEPAQRTAGDLALIVTLCGGHHLTQRPRLAFSRGHLAISLQPRQPQPAVVADLLQVLQSDVPTVEQNVLVVKPRSFAVSISFLKQVVLALAVDLAVDPVIAGDLAVAFDPQQGEQLDAANDLVVLARPLAADQLELLGVELIERAVVDDQDTLGASRPSAQPPARDPRVRARAVQQRLKAS